MNELIVITNNVIGDKEVNSVDARELWVALESKRQFGDWIKVKVLENDFFQEHEDYEVFHNSVKAQPSTSQPASANRKDYVLKTEAAKRVAMAERTSKGEEVRTYFLKCEKVALGKDALTTNNLIEEIGVRSFKATLELATLIGFEGNQALLSANQAVQKLHGIDCLALMNKTALVSTNQVQYFTATLLGKNLDLSAMKMNALMEKVGLQRCERDYKNRIVWIVTSLGKEHSQIIDTGKRHGDGSPVQQIKWAESVLALCESVEA